MPLSLPKHYSSRQMVKILLKINNLGNNNKIIVGNQMGTIRNLKCLQDSSPLNRILLRLGANNTPRELLIILKEEELSSINNMLKGAINNTNYL